VHVKPHERNWVVTTMQFCPKCRLAMIPVKKEKAIVLACPKCGKVTKHSDAKIQKLGTVRKSIVVIGEEDEKSIQTLPTIQVTCQKCGNGEAFYWMVQTRGGDEAMTQFFRCTKCGATWREYS
jgi:DNA-directed RNA polymerase subunit M